MYLHHLTKEATTRIRCKILIGMYLCGNKVDDRAKTKPYFLSFPFLSWLLEVRWYNEPYWKWSWYIVLFCFGSCAWHSNLTSAPCHLTVSTMPGLPNAIKHRLHVQCQNISNKDQTISQILLLTSRWSATICRQTAVAPYRLHEKQENR